MSKKADNKMGLLSLTASAVGVTIGAGVVTLIGRAAGVTGYSTWLAYLVAIFWGMLTVLPYAFVGSALTVRGGNYSTVLNLINKRVAGIYVCSYILLAFNWATFAVGLSDYLLPFMPFMSKTSIAVISILIFYVVNLFGIDIFAKVQGVMTAFLVVMLLFFGFGGLSKVTPEVFNFSGANFLTGGASGFFSAVGLFLYSTVAYQLMLNFSGVTKNPKKNVPLSMLCCIGVLILVYVSVAITATGVLPLDQAIGATLTMTAQAMWPSALVSLFVICGPVMALATTLNGNIASFAVPLQSAARDGWFPKSFAKENRYGAPYIVYTVGAVIALVPVVMGVDYSTIIKNMVIIYNVVGLFMFFSAWNLPTRFPEAWKKSTMHMSDGAFRAVMAVSFVALIGALWLQFRSLSMSVIMITVAAYLIIAAYALYREKKGYVDIKTDQLSVEEAD